MPQKTLGIDIGNVGISALLLESGISGHRIGGYKYIPFSDSQPDDDAITSALKSAVDGMPMAGARCVASIPARHVYFRNLRLPSFEAKKIRPILLFELEPLLPFPVGDLITDFSLFSDSQNPDQTDIVTATTQKAELSRWLDIFKSAGLEPETVTFEGYAMARCLAEMTQVPDDWILAHVDKNTATLFVFHSGQLAFIRYTSIPSEKTLLEDALSSVVHQTIWAFENVFSFDYQPKTVKFNFKTENGNPELFSALEKMLKIPAKPVDFAQGMKSKKNPFQDLPKDSVGINSALSLSLMKSQQIRGINFLQEAFSPKTRFAEYQSDFFKTGLIFLAALILAGTYLFMDMRSMAEKVSRLNAHMTQTFQSAFPEEKIIVDPIAQMKVKIEELKKRSFPIERKGPWIKRIDLLKEISARVPTQMDVNILKLTTGDEDLVMTGNTDTFNTVNDMKSQLEGCPLFKEITISSTNLNRSGNRVDFVLTIRF
ncbi:MAG: hypothetical protein COX20_03105 [Desulfobacterales bacterium CG23_combo_of_CG06-09_8_20_14_all_52_9]|nr:MAG: hypothetical protein COX20_03105 [Desulfobacterales bacterium CG23_combo_of_CG06-09_8_20_14_all_52_9]